MGRTLNKTELWKLKQLVWELVRNEKEIKELKLELKEIIKESDKYTIRFPKEKYIKDFLIILKKYENTKRDN